MFTSWFPNPRHISEGWDEEKAKKAIDTLLNYRRKEVLGMFALLWLAFLSGVFTLLVVIRAAFLVF